MDGGTLRAIAKSGRIKPLFGVLVVTLMLSGCSKAPADTPPETSEAATTTTAVSRPVSTTVVAGDAGNGLTQPAPAATTSLPDQSTTTVIPEPTTAPVNDDDAPTSAAEAPEITIEDFTTGDLDSLLDELDDILRALDSSLAEEEGDIRNG